MKINFSSTKSGDDVYSISCKLEKQSRTSLKTFFLTNVVMVDYPIGELSKLCDHMIGHSIRTSKQKKI